ncbi:MAG: D-glycero-beta-D-manno-heptose-7-phosphate kinase [Deltaproteobacteria bacterium]|jgi:rfaE bifunctional protein kinase chain/domain|nr:D-glycero-beta-D-manno-heptose-7-phosphate kinase [Deltaproteobacteria bacterium]
MPGTYAFDRQGLMAKTTAFRGNKVLLVGDVMLDEYLEGDAERISPEAPIPIVKVANTRFLLGGAGNVARNIASLGGQARLVGVRGGDAKGGILESLLAEGGVASSLASLPRRPTTLKTRVIARNQQMLRIDQEDSAPLAPEETAGLLDAIRAVIDEYSVLVISDYGKGVVSRELVRGLFALRDASRSRPRILVDPKPPNIPLYGGVFILTPNARETSEAARLPVKDREQILAAGRAILQSLRCERLLTTLGANGMALFLSPQEVWHIPTAAQKVFDVTGAGDTVMATLALSLASGLDLLDSCVLANYAAGIVVADIGAGAVSAAALAAAIGKAAEPAISRWA